MQYLILSDVHLGCTTPDMIVKLQLVLANNKDKTVIWNGDIIDILIFENSYQVYDKFIAPNDIHLVGNHDYCDSLQKSQSIKTPHNNVIVVHGDLIDFGLGFKLLECLDLNITKMLLRKRQFRLLAILMLLKLFRRWTVNDCFVFYKELIALSDDDVGVFHHSQHFKLKNLKAYLRTFKNILLAPKSKDGTSKINDSMFEPCITEDGKYWGLVTHDPKVLLERTLLMYPECVEYDTIIIGHIHHKADEIIKASNGREYRMIVLGAWVGDVIPSYVTLDSDTGKLEVTEIRNHDE